jgi:signal transduction histidine kinase/ABC-type uncharacterized transport system substrate-binding protein
MAQPSTVRAVRVRHFALVALLVLLTAPASEAAGRRVLILQSLDRGNLALDFFTGNFRVDVDQGSQDRLTFTQFVVNPSGFDDSPEKAMVDYLLALFAERPKPDLVVTIGGPAAAFARKHRQALFPTAPLLLAAVDERFLEGVPLAENETAVAVRNDISAIVDDILQLFPQTSNVFMVLGSGELSRFWRAELGRQFRRFENRVSFTWSDGMSFGDILKRVSALPPHSAIFYMTFDTDTQGGAYPEDRVFLDLHAAANAPLFATQDRQLGHGIVGGRLMLTEELGHVAAGVALRILGGESPGRIKTPVQVPGSPVFDWRELERWNVGAGQLPAGSIVHFREPGVWQRYKWVIVVTASVLLAQTFLIAALLVNRRERRRAERTLRVNVTALEDAEHRLGDARRRLAEATQRTALAAMTASIAHELNQPLGAIVLCGNAGLRLLDSAEWDRDQARSVLKRIVEDGRRASEILARIRAMFRHDRQEALPLSVNELVQGVLALARGELTSRHIALHVELTEPIPTIVGDRVLLQQVVLNLVMNAVEAMTLQPAPIHHLAVQTTPSDSDAVLITIADDGPGIPAEHMDRIFEAFFTTKADGMGMGLSICQSIVEAHGGRLWATARAPRGTRLHVRLPLSV